MNKRRRYQAKRRRQNRKDSVTVDRVVRVWGLPPAVGYAVKGRRLNVILGRPAYETRGFYRVTPGVSIVLVY